MSKRKSKNNVHMTCGTFYQNATYIARKSGHTDKWKRDFIRLADDFQIAGEVVEQIISDVLDGARSYDSNLALYERARRQMLKAI